MLHWSLISYLTIVYSETKESIAKLSMSKKTWFYLLSKALAQSEYSGHSSFGCKTLLIICCYFSVFSTFLVDLIW